MSESTAIALIVLGSLVYLGVIYALTTWAIQDAEARGKTGWAVALLVCVLPIGVVLWMLLRPPLLAAHGARNPFRLDQHRVQ